MSVDDLDRLLADTMRDAAGQAPPDHGLLDVVHLRSGRLRRRRIATSLSAVAAVVAVGIPTIVVLNWHAPAPAPPAAVVPSATPSPARTSTPTTSATATPKKTADAVRLVAGFDTPVFPYALPATNGMKAPVGSMLNGSLVAFFEATEIQHHSDITVTVSSSKPAFTGTATKTSMPVRGHTGTLRTVDVQPAKQLTLYWQERAGRWITLATDDTYTPQQVVALADSLAPASVAVLPPFKLDLSPSGFAADTISQSTMSFRSAASEISIVLHKRRSIGTSNVTVGKYKGSLTHTGAGPVLDVDVTDWNATLEVTAGSGLTMSDADLVRLAAGVHILNRSNPE